MDFSCDPVKCLECGEEFPYSNGYFVLHLKRNHNMSLRDYVVKFEYGNDENKVPKCQCGYCNEPVPFWRGKFKIGTTLQPHRNYEWQKEQYIKKYGIPKCLCGSDILNFTRGKPNQTCGSCHSTVKLNMKQNNPMKNPETAYKAADTFCSKINSGEINFYKTKKYKETDLNYQSSYELDFLKLCDKIEIIKYISNGKWHKFLNEDKKYGENLITDFCYKDNYEIEIKSSYILKKQGGMEKLFAKKKAVESTGKQYIFILDKDYTEFLSLIKT